MTDLITKAREGRMNALKARAALGTPAGGPHLRLAAWSDGPVFSWVRRIPAGAQLG